MILRNMPAEEERLLRQGCFQYALFPPETLQELYNAVTAEMQHDRVSFYYSGADKSLDRKKYFYGLVLDHLQPHIEKILPDYTISRIIVVMKGIGQDSSCKLHTDDNSFDERQAFPVNIWTPLVPTSEANGGLFTIPGSHLFVSPFRGFNIPQYYEAHQDALLEKGVPVTTQLGDSLIYHPGILHFSKENNSTSLRPAIVIGLAPKSQQQLVYWGEKDFWGLKILTIPMTLQEYILWDEKSVPREKVSAVTRFRKLGVDQAAYRKFLEQSRLQNTPVHAE